MTVNYWLNGKIIETVLGDEELVSDLEKARDAQEPININGPLYHIFSVFHNGNEVNVYLYE